MKLSQYLTVILNYGAEPAPPRDHLKEGLAAFEAGDYNTALSDLTLALETGAADFSALYSLGRIHLAGGRLEEAQSYLEKALMLNKRDASAHFYLGEVHAASKRAEQAEAAYRKAVELSPTCTDAFIKLGMLLQGAGRLPEALVQFERAIALDAKAVVARFHLARLCVERGDYQRAICQLTWVQRLEPNYVPVFALLAEAYLRQGAYRSAISELERLIQHGEASASVYLRIGKAQIGLKNPEGALTAFLKAIELDGKLWAAQFAAGQIFESQLRFKPALKCYLALLDSPAHQATAKEAIGRIRQKLAQIDVNLQAA